MELLNSCLICEAADQLSMTAPYLIRIAKTMNLSDSEFREAGKRNYLFSESAIEKLRKRFGTNDK